MHCFLKFLKKRRQLIYDSKKRVIKLSIPIILLYSSFLIAVSLKKYVIKLLIDVFLHLLIFLIDSDRVISEDPFMLVYFPDKYKTQKSVMKLLMTD